MKPVIIFGTGHFAEVAHFYLTNDSKFNVAYFTANKEHIVKEKLLDLNIVPFEDIEIKYPPEKYDMFIAIAYSKIKKVRAEIFQQAKTKGYNLITYVNSKVIKWGDIDIGENCFILENVVIQPFVKIGNNVIMWSGNHVGHHSIIGDHCFITSHVVVSGNVTIGPYCFLGVNSTIRDGISIASECVIGAGTVILKNTKQKQVYTTKSTILISKASDELKNL